MSKVFLSKQSIIQDGFQPGRLLYGNIEYVCVFPRNTMDRLLSGKTVGKSVGKTAERIESNVKRFFALQCSTFHLPC